MPDSKPAIIRSLQPCQPISTSKEIGPTRKNGVPAASRGKKDSACDDRYRYIRYSDGTEELYDHQTDPNEWTNIAKNPELAPPKPAWQKLCQICSKRLR